MGRSKGPDPPKWRGNPALFFAIPIAGRDYSGYILAGGVCYGNDRDPDNGCRDCGYRWWKNNLYKNDESILKFLRDYMSHCL